MVKVHSDDEHDFYIQVARGDQQALYNIVSKNSPVPAGGYPRMNSIEKLKGVRFPDRYRKELHGVILQEYEK